jgi:hypothetical protein
LSSQFKYISLIGDFNGRTSVEKDYFLFDEKDEANTFSDFIENGASCLDLLESPRERKIKDLGKNRHGALLLDCCKGNNMFILNGRLSGDKPFQLSLERVRMCFGKNHQAKHCHVKI